jgi:uncharacterized repeat protein (TIGR01451 family)
LQSADVRAPAPLLHVRFTGPQGLRVTFYQGTPEGKEFPTPVAVGLRPGYVYRIKVSGIPGHPNQAFYPTLEVRGMLIMPPALRAADHPAPVVFSNEDLEQVLAGAFLTKIIFLEHPDQALPTATKPDQPWEVQAVSVADAIAEARVRGRTMLILRWGGREASAQELARQSIPGTILLPGEQMLAPPAVPPCIRWDRMHFYDPIIGPRGPEEECLHDGGDVGRRAGIDRSGQLGGIDPTDTVAGYADSKGRPHVAVSNRVCICVPRFAVIRASTLPAGYDISFSVGQANTAIVGSELTSRIKTVAALQAEQLRALSARERPSGMQIRVGTTDINQFLTNASVFGFVESQAVAGLLQHLPLQPPDRPLVLTKCADKQAAQVGDLITFTLKYANTGGQPITGIVVADSLTGRLEYIIGSAKTDRPANFTTQLNEAGSVILRWETTSPLPPGQTGTVTFQARIR